MKEASTKPLTQAQLLAAFAPGPKTLIDGSPVISAKEVDPLQILNGSMCSAEFTEVTAGFTGRTVEAMTGGGIDPKTGMVLPGHAEARVWAGVFPTAAVAEATFNIAPEFRRWASAMERGPETTTYYSYYLPFRQRAYIVLNHRNVVALVDWPTGVPSVGPEKTVADIDSLLDAAIKK